jgi:GTP-binding protein EngB required for normal cell division
MDSPKVPPEQAELKTPEIVPSGSAEQADWGDLRTYTRAKQSIAGVVRRLETHFRRSASELRAAACRELMVKLAEDRFTLAVLGQFNRGKSSLMNAIMGRQILPTGVLPLTSAITVLKFGSREQLVVERKGWSLPQTAPFSALAGFVTQQGNPGNEKRVERVCVELPLPFLRRGLEFVDTPGVGSAVDANTATTMAFLPRCDAALFVTSVDTPLTVLETELLSRLRQYVRKIIFVINKTDLLAAPECREVVAYIAEALQRQMGTSSLKVYATSSRRGLAAKLAGDQEAYRQSGLGPLEEAISSFLAVEKSSTFLVAVLDKAAAIASHELQELDVAGQAQGISSESLREKSSQLEDRFRQLNEDRDRGLLQLREQAQQHATKTIDAEFRAFLSEQTPLVLEQLHRAVNDSHGWLASGVAKLAAGRALHDLGAKLTAWIGSLKPRLEEEINRAAGPAKASLESQLAAIPSAAGSVLGGVVDAPLQQGGGAEPLPSLNLPELSPRQPEWSPTVTRGVQYVPLPLGRRRLRECLRYQLGEAFAACRSELSTAVERGVNQAVDRLASVVRVRARQAESRLIMALTGRAGGAAPPAEDSLRDAAPASGREEIAEIQQSLSSLRDAILRHDAAGLKALDQGPAVVVASPPTPIDAATGPAPDQQPDRRSELQQGGCPVCNRLVEAAFDFYAHWQYKLSADEPTQRAFADQWGFCPLHTWQLASLASPQGLSLGYPKLLERLSAALSGLSGGPSRAAGRVAALIPSPESCRVCILLQSAEREQVAGLCQFLAEPSGRDAYTRSQGVCLRHLAAFLALSPPADLATFLLSEAARRFDQLAEDMRNYAIKHDAIRSGLLTDDEEWAYLRALVHLSGHKSLRGPWST